MWIQTQNKQRIINSDQIIDIFIDKLGKTIYAETTCNGEAIVLGMYANRDISTQVLTKLQNDLGWPEDIISISMPLGGDAVKWLGKS